MRTPAATCSLYIHAAVGLAIPRHRYDVDRRQTFNKDHRDDVFESRTLLFDCLMESGLSPLRYFPVYSIHLIEECVRTKRSQRWGKSIIKLTTIVV